MESPMELDEADAGEKQLGYAGGGGAGADEARRFHSFRSKGHAHENKSADAAEHAYRTPYDRGESEPESDADGDAGERTPRLEVHVASPLPPGDHPLQQRDRSAGGHAGSRTGLSGLIASLGASGPDLRLHFGGGGGNSRRGSREKEHADGGADAHDEHGMDRRGGAHRGTRDYPHLPKAARKAGGGGAAAEEREERAGLVQGGGARESDSESEREVSPVDRASGAGGAGPGAGRPISGMSIVSGYHGGAATEHARNWDGIDVDSRAGSRASTLLAGSQGPAVMRAQEDGGADSRWRSPQAYAGSDTGPSPGTTPRGEYPPRVR